jgi:tetratricopeptide (TPR) repeat protein
MNPRPDLPAGAGRRRLLPWVVGGLTLAGLGVGVGVGVAGRTDSPEAELREAEQAYRRYDFAAARAHLGRCLARRPDDDRALFLAAQAARRADACADAEQALMAFERKFGPTAASRLEWALLGAQQGDFADEEGHLLSDIDHDQPDAPEALEALAKGYDAAYRWPDALALLDRLLDRVPDHVPALLVRGTIRDRLRQADGAEADLRRAAELAPENAAARVALAGLLNRLGRTREAIAQYESARRSRPTDPATLLGLARAFADAADLDEAESRLDELLAADPDSADGLVERGRLALRRGRPAEAEPFLARAVQAAPERRDGQELYLAALKDQGRTEAVSQGEARLAELRAEDALGGRLKLRAHDAPGDVGVRWDLWQWSRRNGQGEEGFAWLTEILRIDPHNAQAHAALADYFDQAGQPQRAAKHRAAAAGR